MGGFTNHLKTKVKKNGELTECFKSIVRSIIQIKDGTFYSSYEWDDDWLRDYISELPDPSGYSNYVSVSIVIMKAVKAAASYRRSGILPKSIKEFFYNPMTKKSWFLSFYNNLGGVMYGIKK